MFTCKFVPHPLSLSYQCSGFFKCIACVFGFVDLWFELNLILLSVMKCCLNRSISNTRHRAVLTDSNKR